MWIAWQTWLTQPDKFNLQATISILELWSNIKLRLDPKQMVQHQVYTSTFGVTYQGQKMVQVDPH